jgi:hypothetical protein
VLQYLLPSAICACAYFFAELDPLGAKRMALSVQASLKVCDFSTQVIKTFQ